MTEPFFSKLDGAFRGKIAEYILDCRRKDRGQKSEGKTWVSQDRSLDDYCHRLGIFRSYLETLIQLKISNQKKVALLDVGVGHGELVKELLELYPNKLHVSGIGLTRPSFQASGNYVHHIGLVEKVKLAPNTFDFIFSVRGGFSYTLNSFAACQSVLNSLKEEGVAFLEDRRLLLTQDWFRDYLKGQGFEVETTRFEEGEAVSFKIKRLKLHPLDFSRFNEKYLFLIHRHRETILQWGFDRLREGSPLTELFQDLYSQENYVDLLSV